jgi:uncharacterized membrane protein YuzA (DUF378 family)
MVFAKASPFCQAVERVIGIAVVYHLLIILNGKDTKRSQCKYILQ